jgi:MerR family transcriptional regulator, light-induced transcriptional regulator
LPTWIRRLDSRLESDATRDFDDGPNPGRRPVDAVSSAAPASNLSEIRAAYLAAQLRGDQREALRLALQALDAGYSASQIQEHVIEGAQREIGRLWQENLITIADEHMATAISQMALAHLYDRAPRAKGHGKKIWVACIEGELHDFPARLVADALDLAGFEVRYLGANVPTESLIRMLQRDMPDLLALSVTMAFNLSALRGAIRAIRAIHGPSLPIAVGGNACEFAPGAIEAMGAEVMAGDARQLIRSARQLLGVEVA